jgi:hypothetical protein
MQGYYFSPPVPLEEIEVLLREDALSSSEPPEEMSRLMAGLVLGSPVPELS